MCDENVLKLASIDCSSPISAKIERNTGRRTDVDGKCNPACAISANKPAVFNATVLPPVFGPVISNTRFGGSSRMSTGTASLSNGCRAPLISTLVSAVNTGSMPLTRAP